MMNFLPVLRKDFYKAGHKFQYDPRTILVYSNWTPRSTRIPGDEGVYVFGPQYFVKEWLIRQFNELFFQADRDVVLKAYKRRMDNALGPGMNVNHIGELHELGYLPLRVKALKEGSFCPLRVPLLTLYNTEHKFFWLTNMLETLMSSALWRPITSMTTAVAYLREFHRYAKLTGADPAFIPWQGHDFSMRGMDPDAAITSGAAHLAAGFTGTDTILAIDFLEAYYGANSDTELVGGSVPATEHSVMCMGTKAGEWETIDRLLFEVYPDAPVVSIVSDTWNLWKVLGEYLPSRRERILARRGKVVIRPDSGDPAAILCGNPNAIDRHERLGVVASEFDTFGGAVNHAGFRELDPHIGSIYGDSITRERQKDILGRLMMKGFASSNIVMGIGSFTYSYVTRDIYGQAIKATYGELANEDGSLEPRAIFKDPITDDGTKRSARGLLRVEPGFPLDNGGALRVVEDCDWAGEERGLLQNIFHNGTEHNTTTLAEIRARVAKQL